jgi:hypothetical protein
MPPPGITQLSKAALQVLGTVAFKPLSAQDAYLPWDKLRYRQPPEGLSHEEWWVILKAARNVQKRELRQPLGRWPRRCSGPVEPR